MWLFKLKLMETGELVTQLHAGFVLCKTHHDNPEFKEYLISSAVGQYETKGWCSAIGRVEDRLIELITNPSNWEVMEFNQIEQDYPYPWSTLKQLNEKD